MRLSYQQSGTAHIRLLLKIDTDRYPFQQLNAFLQRPGQGCHIGLAVVVVCRMMHAGRWSAAPVLISSAQCWHRTYHSAVDRYLFSVSKSNM